MKQIRPALTLSLMLPMIVCGQGSLTPPGAPAPTMKSLAQIEPRTIIAALPFTITTPGAYYLTTNLTGLAGTNGITILSSDVTLDLNGFALIGVPGALTAITSAAPAMALTVRSGSIRSWPGGAMNAPGGGGRFEGLNIYSNSGAFALSGGAYARVNGCALAWNSAGISVGPGSTVSECVVHHNTGNGLTTAEAAAVRNCTIYGNSANGIVLGNVSSLEACVVTTNRLSGVLGLTNVSIARCNISLNASNGITLQLGGRVTDCVLATNLVDGIRATARSTITGNLIDFNGLGGRDAGIRLLSSDCRVEDNNIMNNITGILSDLGYNFISRNKATLNVTNYSLHLDDVAGPISADPSAAGPWANFAY